MAENSKIEWTHHTFNHIRGCTKVSPECDHCYADTLSGRNPLQLGVWGPKGTRVVAAESAWKEPLKWDRAAAKAGERHRVFCASLADVFESEATMPAASVDAVAEARSRLFALIDQTPHLDWLLLTKRPENIVPALRAAVATVYCPHEAGAVFAERWLNVGPPANVWLGTSVGNRRHGVPRIDVLRAIPAAVRFLSVEPLLEDLGPLDLTGISWVIVGGESGPGARPMHPAWARTLRDQCNAAGVAFFHKQNGEWWGWSQMSDADKAAVYNPLPPELEYHPDHRNHNPHVKPHQMVFSGGTIGVGESVYRVGKKAAGRLLDGRTWDEFPAAPVTVGEE